MANLRFPSNANNDGKPFILFSTHRARYNSLGNKIDAVSTPNSVALYFPSNYTVSDSLNYQTESTGATGSLAERLIEGGSITEEDVKQIATAGVTDKQRAAILAGAAAGFLGSAVGAGGTLAGGAGAAGIVGNVAAEFSRSVQQTINPREFMLFKNPNIRSFAFNFTLIPSTEKEVRDVPEIIKFFRRASYPDLAAADTVYNFPEAFNINFGNSDKVIKVPEVFCTAINITYNPNSMSYFQVNNLPVEITLALSFQELQPISKKFVDQGY